MGVGNQGNAGNQNGNVVNENIQENVKNVLMNGNWIGCSYKEFLACNPKEYDGKGGSVVLTQRIEKMEFVQDMNGCSIDKKVKYIVSSFVGKALTWWNSQIRTLSQEVAVSMSWNDFKFMILEEFCPSHEMQKLETKLWNHVMVGVGHADYTDRFHELARLVPHLETLETRKIERYVYGLAPHIRGMVAATKPKTMQKAMQISGALINEAVRNGSIKKVEKRGNVGKPSKDKNGRDDNKRTRTGNDFATTANPVGRENMGAWPKLNRAHKPGGNHPNKVVANNEGQGRGNPGNQSRGIEPSELGFRYKIEIASEQLVEIDKVIKGYKLEIEGHVFDIDLIPFRNGSFDVIIGIDWLSNHKAYIICHEKVVRIPLLDDKVLRVFEERPEEKARILMSAKASDKKQEEIVVVRDFPEVFPNDLSGLPPLWEIEFRIELIPEAVSIAKSPYRSAPSEMKELSGQLKELQDKGEAQEFTFQTLKDKLCNALILALPDGPKDFVVYCDASRLGLGCVLMQRELFSDYDCEICYYSGKANVVADALTMDFVTKLPRTSGHDTIWVIVDRVTKSAYFLPMREYYKIDRLARLYLNEIVARHGMPISIISDRDSRFTSRFWQSMQEALGTRFDMSTAYHPQNDGQSERTIKTLEDMLRACILDFKGSWDVHLSLVEFSYNNSYHSRLRVLRLRHCMAESIVRQLCGLGWRSVVLERCGTLWKLALRFVGPFEIIEKTGPVTYKLDLLKELDGVHDTFHVSNLKKCLADPALQVPLVKIQVEFYERAFGNFGKRV
nr:putative reverse transcriptase domain-containing protein [Tanacetum cinerariifolium]